MGHFDFVVTDRNHNPQFAIEFDGGGHDDKNDRLKDEICRQSGLALFRLTPSTSRVQNPESVLRRLPRRCLVLRPNVRADAGGSRDSTRRAVHDVRLPEARCQEHLR
jgi:very-short-patch-repair endonuclease